MNHAHHYVLGMPVKGYTVGTCKHCGAVATFFDRIDWNEGSWSTEENREKTFISAKRSRKRNPRTQPPKTACGKCGRADFASAIGLASHEARWCKGVAA